MCPQVRFGAQSSPCPGIAQDSLTKVPIKAKWNSNVRCQWPPEQPSSPTAVNAEGRSLTNPYRLSSPSRVAGGGRVRYAPRRPTPTADTTKRNLEANMLAGISVDELVKKVETLELELDVHVGNELKLLTVNELLRTRSVIVVDQNASINLAVAVTKFANISVQICSIGNQWSTAKGSSPVCKFCLDFFPISPQLRFTGVSMSGGLEACLREFSDSAIMVVQLDNLNEEMEKKFQLLRNLSER